MTRGTHNLENFVLRLLQEASDAATNKNGTQGDNGGTRGGPSPPSSGGMPNSSGGSRQAYEFFAFLLWYLLLVLCCLIPTCCAYRRRRHLEARLSQQQEIFENMQQQNLVFLNSLTQRQNANEAVFNEQRCQLVNKAVEETTMIVQDKDIEERRRGEVRPVVSSPAVLQNDDVGNTSGQSMGAVACDEDTTALLRLPNDVPNGNRMVPAACAICLNSYERGDGVTWSPMQTCQHAFHRECIIPWLTNKSECPCCRQEFCSLPVSMRISGNRLAWNRFQQPTDLRTAAIVVASASEVHATAVGVNLTPDPTHDVSFFRQMEEGLSPAIQTIATETAVESGTAQSQPSPDPPSEYVHALTAADSRVCSRDDGMNAETVPSLDGALTTSIYFNSSPDSEPLPLPRTLPNEGAAEESIVPTHSS